MRYLKIFALHFQDVVNNRGRSFVWFLVSLINPLILLLFWQGVIRERGVIQGQWTANSMTSYYLLLTIASSFLVVHIEEDIAWRDIKEGTLAKYLVRPFSYFLLKFMEEIPWRFIQGFFGLLVFLFFATCLKVNLPLVDTPLKLLLALIIILLGLGISFVFKMILGLSALWTTDFWGTLSFEEIGMLLLGGIAMPLTFYPQVLQQVAQVFPLAYIIYFPVVAIEGMLPPLTMIKVIVTQIGWLLLLWGIYIWIWRQGIKKFTAVGQ